MGHPDFDYQLDVNITKAEGIVVKVMNGTSIETASDLKSINLRDLDTLELTKKASLPDGKTNQIFLLLKTDPEY